MPFPDLSLQPAWTTTWGSAGGFRAGSDTVMHSLHETTCGVLLSLVSMLMKRWSFYQNIRLYLHCWFSWVIKLWQRKGMCPLWEGEGVIEMAQWAVHDTEGDIGHTPLHMPTPCWERRAGGKRRCLPGRGSKPAGPWTWARVSAACGFKLWKMNIFCALTVYQTLFYVLQFSQKYRVDIR
jgi:hypothetical protein